ncbi:MAG: ComEC/Rec2 family competence protein [Pseudomonadota bacterium]
MVQADAGGGQGGTARTPDGTGRAEAWAWTGRLADIWHAQRGHLFPWSPVALACGIGLYFLCPAEPGAAAYAGVALAVPVAVLLACRSAGAGAPLLWMAALIGVGFCLAGWRAHALADPVLGWRYYGPVEGRIVGIDRSASDAVRLTLDEVVLRDTAPGRTPGRVRVALHGLAAEHVPAPGAHVGLTAHLAPPSGPVEPGGFDFQRHAWFQGIGAVGYSRVPVMVLAPPDGGQVLFRARMAVSERVQRLLPGNAGAFAAAIMTGDRSGMGQETLAALRVSNLAHLLAISGLHMGLLAGFVFAVVRLGFAAIPSLGLRLPAKKIAALVAMAAAAGYLALSGGNVATERAFVMVSVMLLAVLADRRALSLRGVALAACLILAMRPEALLGPGFQMSFAATTALVAVFAAFRDAEFSHGPRWLRPVLALVLSSGVAGLATAPIAAAHFNQIAHYGLVANLLSVPLMGALVMPMAVLAACLMPLGLDWIALWIMGVGLDWILGVAHWISALDGARGTVPGPGPFVLPAIALGMLFLILWQGRLRFLGIIPVGVAFLVWADVRRPDVLIADSGALVGVMTQDGRALSRAKGAGFVARNWLENDGDAADQATAHARWAEVSLPILALTGARAAATLTACAPADLVVLNVALPADLPVDLPCRVIHPDTLRDTGAIALYAEPGGLREVTARDISGTRLWNDADTRRAGLWPGGRRF